MDKRVVDRGRVGVRAKEALVDGLKGLLNDASLGVVFLLARVLAGEWGWSVGRWELRK